MSILLTQTRRYYAAFFWKIMELFIIVFIRLQALKKLPDYIFYRQTAFCFINQQILRDSQLLLKYCTRQPIFLSRPDSVK